MTFARNLCTMFFLKLNSQADRFFIVFRIKISNFGLHGINTTLDPAHSTGININTATQMLKSSEFHGSLISIILSKEYKKEKRCTGFSKISILGAKGRAAANNRHAWLVCTNEHEQRVL